MNVFIQLIQMNWQEEDILYVLDRCCENFTFPMLDNGYVYLAATRLSLYRSEQDWAIVIEVFGFSPRAGLPDTHVHTFASRLHDRKLETHYVSKEAYENYLTNNPHNESRFFFPVAEGKWQDPEDFELVADGSRTMIVRGKEVPLPEAADYIRHDITLEAARQVRTFELCRALAASARNEVLANAIERRASVRPEMQQILQLEEWAHPDVVDEHNRPSSTETFQQLARVLVTGDVAHYLPTLAPNTHWKNWPDGGSL